MAQRATADPLSTSRFRPPTPNHGRSKPLYFLGIRVSINRQRPAPTVGFGTISGTTGSRRVASKLDIRGLRFPRWMGGIPVRAQETGRSHEIIISRSSARGRNVNVGKADEVFAEHAGSAPI
jgi:hypothetical protein